MSLMLQIYYSIGIIFLLYIFLVCPFGYLYFHFVYNLIASLACIHSVYSAWVQTKQWQLAHEFGESAQNSLANVAESSESAQNGLANVESLASLASM
jgi:hypothetical protein